ncbi:hypothetical protein GCM10010399_42530 [Dactylosporangium fulvum]
MRRRLGPVRVPPIGDGLDGASGRLGGNPGGLNRHRNRLSGGAGETGLSNNTGMLSCHTGRLSGGAVRTGRGAGRPTSGTGTLSRRTGWLSGSPGWTGYGAGRLSDDTGTPSRHRNRLSGSAGRTDGRRRRLSATTGGIDGSADRLSTTAGGLNAAASELSATSGLEDSTSRLNAAASGLSATGGLENSTSGTDGSAGQLSGGPGPFGVHVGGRGGGARGLGRWRQRRSTSGSQPRQFGRVPGPQAMSTCLGELRPCRGAEVALALPFRLCRQEPGMPVDRCELCQCLTHTINLEHPYDKNPNATGS